MNNEKKPPFRLTYRDYKKLEEILEAYNMKDGTDIIDFNGMQKDEKEILWKIKTIIRNMESVRLRSVNDATNPS